MDLEDEYRKIYSDYLDVIVPSIAFYETVSNSFPIGILNEIRAIFTHLAKSVVLNAEEDKVRQIGKAKGHIVRAIRDCYKYNCMAVEEKYKVFMTLTAISEGIREDVFSLHEKAIDALFVARRMEGSVDSDAKDKEIYEQYKKAYEIYLNVDSLIKENSNGKF